jgi:hypothetical protein
MLQKHITLEKKLQVYSSMVYEITLDRTFCNKGIKRSDCKRNSNFVQFYYTVMRVLLSHGLDR